MLDSAFTSMPDAYTFEQAATLPCAAATAWRALMVEAKVKPGDTVLVQGSGGVSTSGVATTFRQDLSQLLNFTYPVYPLSPNSKPVVLKPASQNTW